MPRPRVRALPTSFSTSKDRRPPHPRFVLDGLGLHRVTRQAIRDLNDRVEQLESLVGLLDSIASEVFAGDQAREMRAAATIIQTTLAEIVARSIDAAVAVGQVRFAASLRSIEIEEGPDQ
jgi:ribosomal protein L30/L7E